MPRRRAGYDISPEQNPSGSVGRALSRLDQAVRRRTNLTDTPGQPTKLTDCSQEFRHHPLRSILSRAFSLALSLPLSLSISLPRSPSHPLALSLAIVLLAHVHSRTRVCVRLCTHACRRPQRAYTECAKTTSERSLNIRESSTTHRFFV